MHYFVAFLLLYCFTVSGGTNVQPNDPDTAYYFPLGTLLSLKKTESMANLIQNGGDGSRIQREHTKSSTAPQRKNYKTFYESPLKASRIEPFNMWYKRSYYYHKKEKYSVNSLMDKNNILDKFPYRTTFRICHFENCCSASLIHSNLLLTTTKCIFQDNGTIDWSNIQLLVGATTNGINYVESIRKVYVNENSDNGVDHPAIVEINSKIGNIVGFVGIDWLESPIGQPLPVEVVQVHETHEIDFPAGFRSTIQRNCKLKYPKDTHQYELTCNIDTTNVGIILKDNSVVGISSTEGQIIPSSEFKQIYYRAILTKDARIAGGVPNGWTCEDHMYGGGDGCDCQCGTYDIDCDDPNQILYNCVDTPNAKGCSLNGNCIPSNWGCPLSFFDSNDGCDCSCGNWDEDCTDQYDPFVFACSSMDKCVKPGICGMRTISPCESMLDVISINGNGWKNYHIWPTYDNSYQGCVILDAGANKIVQWKVLKVNLEHQYDFLTAYDISGFDANAKTFENKVQIRQLPNWVTSAEPIIRSSGRYLLVELSTDDSNVFQGFRSRYKRGNP